MRLVHITTAAALLKIKEEGLRARTHFIDAERGDIASYYAETVSDEGQRPVRIEVDLEQILALGHEADVMAPDWGGIEEPLTYTLRRKEEEIWENWNASSQGWRDSIELIGTCRVELAISPDLIKFPGNKLCP